jgi:hypothetical protein
VDENVVIELTGDEALVLFEWLVPRKPAESGWIDDEAERVVLWRIEALLERALVEPLSPDYAARVEVARRRVRDGDEAG